MSRIGKKIIELKNVKAKLTDSMLTVEGTKGKLTLFIPDEVVVDVGERTIQVNPGVGPEKRVGAFRGLIRALIQNNVTGVSDGYEKRLEINGVGFRAKLEGKVLVLSLGFSHPIRFDIPEGISIKVEQRDTLLIINGIDKQLVGQVAATIRAFYPPEPYKGKGVKYSDEVIRRKKGKRVA